MSEENWDDDYCERCAGQSADIKYLGVFTSSPLTLRGSFSDGISVDSSCISNISTSMMQENSYLFTNGIILQEGDAKRYLYVKALPFHRGNCAVGLLKNSPVKEHVLVYKTERHVLVAVVRGSMTSYEGAEVLNQIAVNTIY